MSWSVSAMGKAAAVAQKVAADLERQKCPEPEQAIKTKLGEVAAMALAALPDNTYVKVEGGGHQNAENHGKFVNAFKIEVTPLYGFIE